jgi:hypothetical protein
VTFTVTADGSSWYMVDGRPSNPALQLQKGRTYIFNNLVADAHPLFIKSAWTNGYEFDTYDNGTFSLFLPISRSFAH